MSTRCLINCGLRALLTLLAVTAAGPVADAQGNRAAAPGTESPAAAHMRSLNYAVLQLHGQMQRAAPHEEGLLRSQAATALAERAAALSDLIENNPYDALSFAFSPELLAELATKLPQAAARLESHTTVSGPVKHWIADDPDQTSRSWWQMDAGGRRLNLYFAGPEPGSLTSDEVLEATGVVAGSNMAVETSVVRSGAAASGSSPSPLASRQSPVNRRPATGSWHLLVLGGLVFGVPGLGSKIRLSRERTLSLLKHPAGSGLLVALLVCTPMPGHAQSFCSTTGEQQVAVLVVTFPGVAVPTFSPSLYDQFFGPAPSLNDYWTEVSYGVTSATGNVFGPFTLTGTYGCSNLQPLLDDALVAASAAGVDFNRYRRVEIVYPDLTPSCGWAAFSTVGCNIETTSAGTFNVSASFLAWPKLTMPVILHESGHQLGLDHAHGVKFPDTNQVLGPLTDRGTVLEYGDNYSAMSSGVAGHYAAGHKADQLGWLSAGTTFQEVNTSGTYIIEPYELQPAGIRALKIQRGTANAGYYLWVEYRQPLGNYDPTLTYAYEPNGNVFSGALIHYESPVTASIGVRGTYLLGFTIPDTYGDFPALLPGQTWTDPYSDVSLSVVSATPTSLTLNVNYSGSVPCAHANPSVSITPLNPSTYPGTGVSYSVSIINNDSAGCSASTYTPSSTQPAGFTPTFSASSISVSPGQRGSLTMTQTPPAGTSSGTYPISASASSASYVGTATANLTVVAPPSATLTVSVPASSYTRKSTVPITATVLDGGSPVSRASVTFRLTTPDGTQVAQSAPTSRRGTATWNYKLSPSAPTGTYSVSGQASYTAAGSNTMQTASSNTVTFTVK